MTADAAAALPAQLRWGLGVAPPRVEPADHVVLAGMGGSGMAAEVGALAAAEGDAVVVTHHDHGLPAWARSGRPLVVAVSYSGNTEETLDAVQTALELRLPVAGVSSGGRLAEMASRDGFPLIPVDPGRQPRDALGQQAAAVLRILEGAGAVADTSARLEAAASAVAEMVGDGDGPGAALASDLASALDHRITIVYGAEGPAALAAYRWKTQINENAKMPAWSGRLPELDHNEIEGWGVLADLARRSVGIVMLHDPGADPRNRRRAELTLEAIAGRVEIAGEVVAQGQDVLERVFTLVGVGDLVSLEMARRHGVDPAPIEVLEGFKRRLREEPL